MNIENWEAKVIEYTNTLNSRLKANSKARELYYGFEIIDGKLKVNPKILFIGINPGKGSEERHLNVKFDTERISYLDPFTEGYKYTLAEETIKLLKLAGLTSEDVFTFLEKDCVKTNLHHIITDTEKDIRKAIDCLGPGEFKEYYKQCTEFCVNLIEILKPKVVVFEGKGPYEEIVQVCFEQQGTWNKEYNYGCFYSEASKTSFIGYARHFSNISSNKVALGEKIKKLL